MTYPPPRCSGDRGEATESVFILAGTVRIYDGRRWIDTREGYFEGLLDLAGKSEEERTEFFLRHDTFWV